MIKQPIKGSRNVNDLFYEEERRQIEELNREFFSDVELTKKENDVLVWLCGLDDWTINVIVEVFRKVRDQQMAKDRITACKYYIAFGICSKGREACHNSYCQRCDKYIPRIREKHINKKKQELEKIRKSERW